MAFNNATRQNQRYRGRLEYAANQEVSMDLPSVGLLARIHVLVTGELNVVPGTGTAALSEKAPWNLIRRARYEIGSGTTLWNTSGWGAYLVDLRSKLGYEPEDGQINAPFAGQVYQAAAAPGVNQIRFGLTIPIVMNERDTLGMILLQSQGTVTQLMLNWQQAAGPTSDFPVVVTGNAMATFTGRARIFLETFTLPAALEDQPPLDRVFQTLETVESFTQTGEIAMKLLEENTYVRLIHSVQVNGALSTDAVERRALRYNLTDVPYEFDRDFDLYLERRRYTRDMPKGVYVWEFFDQGYPNFGSDRDLVQASGLAELESLITIGAGTTLGSNNNTITTVRQQIVPLRV